MKRVCLIPVVLSITAAAQDWVPLDGPGGGHVTEFVAIDDVLLAATTSGLSRSLDGALTWEQVDDGPNFVISMTTTADRIVASDFFGNVFTSGRRR